MWFIVSWADTLGYNDLCFELKSDGTPRKWKRESAAKSWAKKNCAFNFKLVWLD